MFPVGVCNKGDVLCVHRLCGGCEFRRTMAERGIVPGARIEILQEGGGPILVRVGETRLILGAEMANKILVEVCAA